MRNCIRKELKWASCFYLSAGLKAKMLNYHPTLCPAQAARAIEYVNFISTEEYNPTAMNVLDMTLNNLMVMFLGLWGMWSTPSLPLLSGPL